MKICGWMNVDKDGKSQALAMLFDKIIEGELRRAPNIEVILELNRRLLIDAASIADVDEEGFHVFKKYGGYVAGGRKRLWEYAESGNLRFAIRRRFYERAMCLRGIPTGSVLEKMARHGAGARIAPSADIATAC